MKFPDLIENPVSKAVIGKVKKHPYLASSLAAGLVFAATTHDLLTVVNPIAQSARREGYEICGNPTQEERDFMVNLPSNASSTDRQKANQIEAREQGCQTVARVLEQKALVDNGRRFHIAELLLAGGSGAALFGIGVSALINRRRYMAQTST